GEDPRARALRPPAAFGRRKVDEESDRPALQVPPISIARVPLSALQGFLPAAQATQHFPRRSACAAVETIEIQSPLFRAAIAFGRYHPARKSKFRRSAPHLSWENPWP